MFFSVGENLVTLKVSLSLFLCVFKWFQEFAIRALGKVDELATLEDLNEAAATTETHRAFKEASAKARTLCFYPTL